ncbi:MAG TPA: hypothetical protein VHH35_02795 [Pyrinomonadaceae bacterium]|nr:hypothetical protein [Pyrinomonadaceae bacterium]
MSFVQILGLMFMISVAGATGMQRIPTGVWGGNHARLEVGPKSANIEYDCAHGVIEGPLEVDANGRFSLRGTVTPKRGGPVRSDEKPRSVPVTYFGFIKGEKMMLTVKLPDGDETFTLEKGREANLFKCK